MGFGGSCGEFALLVILFILLIIVEPLAFAKAMEKTLL
ncbi:YjcZ family sporulation protein [Bacillus toyonensis]